MLSGSAVINILRKTVLISCKNSANIYLFIFKHLKEVWNMSWRGSGAFIVNFEYIAHLFLRFLLLNLGM